MRVANRPNVIVTPHGAWASDDAQQALADQLMETSRTSSMAGQAISWMARIDEAAKPLFLEPTESRCWN